MTKKETSNSLRINELAIPGFKKVIKAIDSECGLEAYIAIHSTTLGPALGGVRMYPYLSEEEALEDVLRLAKAMTYKASLAELGLGGGKSVIISKPDINRSRVLEAFSAVVDYLKGEYIVAEDVGTSVEDMDFLVKRTPYVAATELETSSGDPSRFTAWGTFKGIKAALQHLYGTSSLEGTKVLIQGLGNVGQKLARLLFWAGADLYLTEKNAEKLKQFCIRYGGTPVPIGDEYATPCDVFAPCALGAVINEETVPQLKCAVIAGCANNQLSDLIVGEILHEKNILYAPDYVINAGGLINAALEFGSSGYNPQISRRKVEHIYDVLLEIFSRSKKENRSPSHIAEDIAEHNLAHGIGKREEPISFRTL